MGLSSSRGPALDAARLHRLVTLGQELVSALDRDTVLRRVVDTARELTGARYGALGVLDRRRRELEQFITSGIDEETRRAIGDLPRGRGVLGVLIEDPRPLRLADVGEHPRSYGFPSAHPPMKSFLGMPIRVRGKSWGNLYLAEKSDGPEFTDADEAAVAILAAWAGVAIDNAEAYRREHERRVELEQAVAALEATTAIARALGGETDLDVILELIAERGRNLIRARGLAFLLRDGQDLVVRAQAGELAPMVGRRVPIEGSVSGHVLTQGRPERLRDVPSRLHSAMAEAVQAAVGLFVPLEFRGRRLGVLTAFDRLDGEDFTLDDERLLESFAASAATAVATAQNVAERELHRSIEAAEGERRRWARELHDETLQDLGAVRLLLASVRASEDVGAGAGARLDQGLEQLTLSITGLRHLIADLRPAALDELGIEPALETLVGRLAVQSNLDVTLDVRLAHAPGREESRLVPSIEETIYRLVQEALNNAAKHSEAGRAQVTLVEDEHVVTVSIRDDGDGFDTEQATVGFGLVGMRERVTLAAGTLEIRSAPRQGTTVRAVLPARRRAAPGLTTGEAAGAARLRRDGEPTHMAGRPKGPGDPGCRRGRRA